MTIRPVAAALFLTCFAAPSVAGAQAPSPTHDPVAQAASDCARQRARGGTCTLTIEEERVDGQRVGATGERLDARKFAKLGSLIRLRRDFIVEILGAVHDLD